MILRLWRGWTKPENADRYEELIRTAIFPGILKRAIAGLEGLELFRRPVDGEVEFMTLMRFLSWDAIKAFAGPDWEGSVVPEAARAVLARFDDKSSHYETRVAQPASAHDPLASAAFEPIASPPRLRRTARRSA